MSTGTLDQTRRRPSIGRETARPEGETERGSTSALPLVPAFRPDGSLLNLAALSPADIDFAAMANALSKLPRFNGIYRDPAYSVAQHCVMGADALFAETGDALAAGYFVLSDGQRYLLGDWTRPAVDLVSHHLAAILQECGVALGVGVRTAVTRARDQADAAIFAAASLAPLRDHPRYGRLVADMDDRMLRAEIVALFGARAARHAPAAGRPVPKLTGAIRPWGPAKAEEAFLDRLGRYCGMVVR